MRYVIVGNGVAGTSAAFALRALDSTAAISVIGGESDYFFSRPALMYAFMGRLERRDMEPFERPVYRRERIERIRGWVADLDATRHAVRLDSGAWLPYDRLLIATGSRPNLPAWPGMERVRDGLVHFVGLGDLDACERLARAGRRAVVVGGGLIGVELAECLRHCGLLVTFLVREPWYFPAAMGEAEAAMITEHIRHRGVAIDFNAAVGRVFTDDGGNLTGVETGNGARHECSLLGVAVGVHPAIEWLARVRTPPRVGRGIAVDSAFRTSLADIWAAGDCAELHLDGREPLVEQLWYGAKRQGELAARAMAGEAVAYAPPVFYNSAKFFEIEYTTVGTFGAPGEAEFHARVPGREVSVRIGTRAGAVCGFNMLGSRWNHAVLMRWIEARETAEAVMDRLHEAQFDVEFGRQDLTEIRRQFAPWKARR
jgi:NADPH-dependent 2,4-dienoyl-CoA reductase/sulfur reductase-like enzyme